VSDVLTGADVAGKVEPWGDLTKDVLIGNRQGCIRRPRGSGGRRRDSLAGAGRR
jgi:hypothetical protein